jgi:hypothetical protein
VKLFYYILICSYLFALLDWKVVHYTRTVNRSWLDWMHAHERQYANVTRSVELVVCTPAMMLKPVFYHSFMDVEAGEQEQAAILHTPKPDWRGFWNLPVRGEGWTFVSWSAWAAYWLVPSLVWILAVRRFLWAS